MKPKYLAVIFLCLILIGVIGLIHPLSMSDQAGTSPQPTPVPANPFPEKEYIPITNFTENLTELNAHLAWNYTGEEIHSAAAELRRIFFYAYDVGSDTYQIPGFAAYSSQIKYALNLSSEQEVAFLRYLQSEFYGEEQKPNSRHTSPVLIRTMGNQREDAESIAK